MNARTFPSTRSGVAFLCLVLVSGLPLAAQQPARLEAAVASPTDAALATDAGGAGDEPTSSVEQGQSHMDDTFELDRRAWRIQKRKEAIEATQFKINLRSYYFDRDKFDD
jgi:hypothetical protein